MSKNIFLYLAITLTVVFAAAFIFTQYIKPALDNRVVDTVVQMPVTSTVVPLSFTFPSGQDALALIEPPIATTSETGVKEVYLMMDNNSYQSFARDGEGTPPPTISIFVLPYMLEGETVELSRTEKLKAWAVQNPEFSSYAAMVVEPQETKVDGVSAILYETDSVYKQDVYVALYNKEIYIFTGQYETAEDEIRTTFADMLDSVVLN